MMPTMQLRKLAFLLMWSSPFLGALGVAASTPPLRLVSDVWPPFTDVEGKPREALDLVKAALLRGKVPSKSKIMTWTDAVAQLESGKLDGSAAVWKSPEREKFLLFSKPYLENRLVLVGRKGEDVSASLAKLAGKRLALTKDYAYGAAVTQAAGVTIVYRNSDADCLRAVLAKEADYLLVDELMVHHLFQFYATKAGGLIAAGQSALVRYPLHFALRRDYPRAQEIIADFDRNVAQMQADGSYNELLHVAWIRTDVNGDGVPDYVASKKAASEHMADPSLSRTAYPVFQSDNAVPDAGPAPAFRVDGKSYDNWADASTNLLATETGPKSTTKYTTGVVLLEF
jgi:polar amino acid transport system substrate-binding protein